MGLLPEGGKGGLVYVFKPHNAGEALFMSKLWSGSDCWLLFLSSFFSADGLAAQRQ